MEHCRVPLFPAFGTALHVVLFPTFCRDIVISMQAIAHGDANCATQKRERTEPSKCQAPTRASTESVQKMSGPDGVKGQLD